MIQINLKITNTSRVFISFCTAFLLLSVSYFLDNNKTLPNGVVFEKETGYYLTRVIDTNIPNNEDSVVEARILFLDFDSHSIKYKNIDGFLPAYNSLYPVFGVLKDGEIENVSVIGGGAYTLSANIADFYKSSNVTVVEVDSSVSDIARKYFSVDENRITTVNEDARVYFNSNKTKYDVIFGDAYNSFVSVPWHLTTLEFVQLLRSRLHDNGIYAVNFISSISGKNSAFFKSMTKTFSEVFPNYYVFAFGESQSLTQNIVLVGIKEDTKTFTFPKMKQKLTNSADASNLARFLINISTVDLSGAITLTDDFAPVEKLMLPTVTQYFPTYINFYNTIFKQKKFITQKVDKQGKK